MKNINYIKILLVLLTVSILSRINAQHICGQDIITHQLRSLSSDYDNDYSNLLEEWQYEKQNARTSALEDTTYRYK